jgi:hypothetical protein
LIKKKKSPVFLWEEKETNPVINLSNISFLHILGSKGFNIGIFLRTLPNVLEWQDQCTSVC